jgi:hypothetical protein
MARRDIEIITPDGRSVADWQGPEQPARPAMRRRDLDGPWSSIFTRARATRQARTLRALTETMEAAKAYYDARQRAVESCVKAQREEYRLQLVPYTAAQEAEHQWGEGEIDLVEIERRYDLAALTRDRDRAEAQSAVTAAHQSLDAQRRMGGELAWKKLGVDLLDIELAIAERRAILRQHFAELDRAMRGTNAGSLDAETMDSALYQARAQLNAHGLDTSAIDTILERRNKR